MPWDGAPWTELFDTGCSDSAEARAGRDSERLPTEPDLSVEYRKTTMQVMYL